MGQGIDCSEILFRGVTPGSVKRSWDGGQSRPAIHHRAFTLRKGEAGLSVGRLRLVTCDEYLACLNAEDEHNVLALSLHTGRVRDRGLNVRPDPTPELQAHALITGLPDFYGSPDEKARAIALGRELVEMSRLAGYSKGPEGEEWRQRHKARREGRD